MGDLVVILRKGGIHAVRDDGRKKPPFEFLTLTQQADILTYARDARIENAELTIARDGDCSVHITKARELPPPTRPDKTVLLMTATITPRPEMRTAIRDPKAREADYLVALEHNLSFLGDGVDEILFVENSNSDVSRLKQIAAGKPCSFLVFDGPHYPPAFGYGYGEFHLLQTAMDTELKDRDVWTVKVTGRYIIENLPSLLRKMPAADLSCDIRNPQKPWIDLRVMRWNRFGFETILRDCYHRLRDDENGFPPEMVLSKHIRECGGDVSTRFPIEPFVVGRRGYDGKDWSSGPLYMKYLLRSALRRTRLII